MATIIADRSTYWKVGGGNTPSPYGDHRFYWRIYYEQTQADKDAMRAKIIVNTYRQTHFTESHPDDWTASGYTYYPSTTSNTSVNGTWLNKRTYDSGVTYLGESYTLTYIGQDTKYVYYNEDGTCSFTWQGTGFDWYTSVSTYTLPRIDRPSVLSNVSTFDVDNGVTINATKYVSSFYDRLQIFAGSTLIQTIPHFTSSKVEFIEEKLNNIYKAIPTGSSGTFTFKLSSYTDASFTNQVGSTSEKTAKGNLKIVLPTFNNFSYVDSNATTSALTSGNSTSSVIVKGYSNLEVSISTSQKATANTRGATMSHYLIDGEKTTYSSSATVTSTRNGYSKNSISVVAVDSRDTSSTPVTKSLSVIEYSAVTKNNNHSYSRSNNGVGSQVTLSFSGKWWNGNFGKVTNTIGATYKYKRSAASSYTDPIPITLVTNGNSYSFNALVNGDMSDNGFDISESYDIIVTVEDELSSVDITYTIHAGEPAMAIYKNKVALGAMYDESLGGTQIWGNLFHNGSPLGQYNPPATSFASMNSNFTSNYVTANDTWIKGFTNAVSYGDYSASTSGNQLVVKNTTLCQISGSTCGRGAGWIRLIVVESSNTNEWIDQTMILSQPSGNTYWSAPIPMKIVKLDPSKTYYIRIIAAPYNNDEFSMNSGFSSDNTWFSALKIK